MRSLFFVFIGSLILSGCSATWSGIKQDTSDALQWTKDRIDGR